MNIVYDSMLGKTKAFALELSQATGLPVYPIHDYDLDAPYVLLTYTIHFGQVPDTTEEFLLEHATELVGVASGGNRVWGDNFGRAADLIGERYQVPVLHKFELCGNPADIDTMRERLGELNETFRTERRSRQNRS